MGRNLYIPGRNKPFITQWTVAGDATARTVTLPIPRYSVNPTTPATYNFNVNWGDGTADSYVNAYNDADRIHTYANNGTYNISITGLCEGWSFTDFTADKLKIVKVISWGGGNRYRGFRYLAGGFSGCTNLISIPATESIPAQGTGCGDLSNLFYGCTNLVWVINDQIFRLQPNVGRVDQCFAYCAKITGAIPADIFKYNTAVSIAQAIFRGCAKLTSIPAHLFDYFNPTSANGLRSMFLDCTGLVGAIPDELFRYNTSLTTSAFYEEFKGCTKLTSFGVDMFRWNTAVNGSATFNYTFSGCSGLTGSIPSDLFKYNTAMTGSGAFEFCFQSCSGLTGAIPSALFTFNTALTGQAFGYCFYSCSKLTSIPSGLFDANTLVTTLAFKLTFGYCSGLDCDIPTDLFKFNTLATSEAFNQTFQYCSKIKLIPDELFRWNTAVTTSGWNQTFVNCTKMQFGEFCFYATGEESTRFLNRSLNVTYCFSRSSGTGATQGTAPKLWNCTYGTGTLTMAGCFGDTGNNSTSVSNYTEIPDLLTLDVAPATDWAAGDIVTGQTSAKTSVTVKKITSLSYWCNYRSATTDYTLGEIVGVTGDASKLADQGATRPVFQKVWR